MGQLLKKFTTIMTSGQLALQYLNKAASLFATHEEHMSVNVKLMQNNSLKRLYDPDVYIGIYPWRSLKHDSRSTLP